MLPYSPSPIGCAQRIIATMKVEGSVSSYKGFTGALRAVLNPVQCHGLGLGFSSLSKNFWFTSCLCFSQEGWGSRTLEWETGSHVSTEGSFWFLLVSVLLMSIPARLRLSGALPYVCLILRVFRYPIWNDWKTTIHGCRIPIYRSFFCEFISFQFFLHLNRTGTVFEIAANEIFGGTSKFNSWTLRSGRSYVMTQNDILRGLERGWIC